MDKAIFDLVKKYLDSNQGDAEAAKRAFFDAYPAKPEFDARWVIVKVEDRFESYLIFDELLNDMLKAPEHWEKVLSQPAAPTK